MEVQEPQTPLFQRNKEDFSCIVCGHLVHGDGYRNHCPHCLSSLHVDNNPGDRKAKCRGIMDVVDIEMNHGRLVFVQKCRKCRMQKKIKAHPEDSIDTITRLMKEFALKK
jgi:hypothetical protein